MILPVELQSRWTDRYAIGWHDADASGYLSPVAICKYLMESAGHHAEHLAFGYKAASQRDEIWVVVQLVVKMEAYPRWGSDCIVETWAYGAEGMYAFREFHIRDTEGHILGSSSSRWMVIDKNTHRPQPMEIVRDALHLAIPEKALKERPDKIPSPSGTLTSRKYEVAYSDIDYNKHVNNTKYVEWVLDTIPMDRHQTHRIRMFHVNYLAEVFYGETIHIMHDSSCRLFEGIREKDQKSVFRIKLL